MPPRTKGVGEWIRDYLIDNGPASATEIHEAYQEWLAEQGRPGTNHQSTRREMWVLNDLGLVERVEDGGFDGPGAYRIVDPDADAWSDPTGAKWGRD